MITKVLEYIFRPTPNMEIKKVRKIGAILSLISYLLIICAYIFIFGFFTGISPAIRQFIPITLFFIGIFFVLGTHRLIWGNTTENPILLSWGKGIISIILCVVIIFCSSLIFGFFMGFIKGLNP